MSVYSEAKGLKGSKFIELSPAGRGLSTVLSRHTETYAECRVRVESARLAVAYIRKR